MRSKFVSLFLEENHLIIFIIELKARSSIDDLNLVNWLLHRDLNFFKPCKKFI